MPHGPPDALYHCARPALSMISGRDEPHLLSRAPCQAAHAVAPASPGHSPVLSPGPETQPPVHSPSSDSTAASPCLALWPSVPALPKAQFRHGFPVLPLSTALPPCSRPSWHLVPGEPCSPLHVLCPTREELLEYRPHALTAAPSPTALAHSRTQCYPQPPSPAHGSFTLRSCFTPSYHTPKTENEGGPASKKQPQLGASIDATSPPLYQPNPI